MFSLFCVVFVKGVFCHFCFVMLLDVDDLIEYLEAGG